MPVAQAEGIDLFLASFDAARSPAARTGWAGLSGLHHPPIVHLAIFAAAIDVPLAARDPAGRSHGSNVEAVTDRNRAGSGHPFLPERSASSLPDRGEVA